MPARKWKAVIGQYSGLPGLFNVRVRVNPEIRNLRGFRRRLACWHKSLGIAGLYSIDTVQDLQAACSANDVTECGASNFEFRVDLIVEG
jgi:hypothetical protein